VYCLQFLSNSATSGKYALIVATPSNVVNIWGGVLSLNQVGGDDQPFGQYLHSTLPLMTPLLTQSWQLMSVHQLPVQINDLYAYQVAFGARMVLEGPYVPSFGADIAGGPPGLGVRLLTVPAHQQ
jgi:hypothetical protein